jgi:N4-gp56 family major capsid protein
VQVWANSTLGGYSAVPSLDAELRQRATATTYFHQLSLALTSYGRHRADRVYFDKIGRMVTPLSTSGIGELDDIPVSGFPWVQGSVITGEYANAVEWTEKLEQYSQFPIGQSVAMVLRQDQIEQLDKVAFAAYNAGRVCYTPLTASTGQFATGGAPTAVAGSAMTVAHVKDITDYLRTNRVPPMGGGKYVAIAHVDHMRGIKDSSEFIQVHAFHDQDRLFDHEVGEYAGVRFLEENNALSSPAGTNTAGFAQAIYQGSDNVVEAVAVAPHLRYKIPTGYGRDRGMASYFIGGFAQVWAFNTDGGEEHQVRADSL